MDLIQTFEKKYLKQNVPDLRPGDTVRIWEKIEEKDKERIQIFEGLVISRKHGNGAGGTFTIRKISDARIGAEKTFPLHSPLVIKFERIKRSKARRAKLNYLRDKINIKPFLKEDRADYKIWEDKKDEEEIKKIEEEKAAQAKQKEEEKKKEESELEEKFKKNIEDRKMEKAKDEKESTSKSGEEGGGSSRQISGKEGNKNIKTESQA